MASHKSWFGPSSTRSRFVSDSSHELPRWRTPTMVPPPIVQSTYSPIPDALAESTIADAPSGVEDKQRELEADLQFLLDAQASGLVQGLEGGSSPDDRGSTGSTTPTVQSVRGTSERRQRTVVRRQPGLRSARKGIYNGIIALSALKDEELQDITGQLDEHDAKLHQIDQWEEKRKGLEEASEHVDASEDTVRVQRLRQEADALHADINKFELQLMDMKSRHRKLLRQAAAVENSLHAKMASYSSSLRLLEEDVQRFLNLKPADEPTLPMQDAKQSIWDLPPKRRNLEMAKHYWDQQRQFTLEKRQQHEYEKKALEDGADLWKEAVTDITNFERRLRSEVASLRPSSPGSHSAWEDPPAPSDRDSGLRDFLQPMDDLLESLGRKYQEAEDKNWKLLIAALAAEIDALKRGKEILAGVLGPHDDNLVDTDERTLSKVDSGDDIRKLDASFEAARPVTVPIAEDHDEPDPELLFSRTDTDTE